jgi:N-acetyl-anhydromuramyl-L-alanine amidase AmpD
MPTLPSKIPFIQAANYTRVTGKSRQPNVIVIHTIETAEKGTAAENTARWFSSLPRTRPVSAHYCIDADSVVQCVQLRDVAWAAPGCNHNGVQLEHAGFARQTTRDWEDEFSRSLLDLSAQLCGKVICPKLGIKPVLLAGKWLQRAAWDKSVTGFTSHAEVSRVFKRSSHTDPGTSFPWPWFLEAVERYLG